MKRPNGFDRGAEPPRPEPEPLPRGQNATPVGDRGAQAAENALGDDSVWRARLSRATRRTSPAGSTADGDEAETLDAQQADAIDDTADDAPLAPTVDLSDVRAARGSSVEGVSPADEHPTVDLSALEQRKSSVLDRFRGDDEDAVRVAERRLAKAAKQRKQQERRERRRFSAESRGRRRQWIIVISAVAALMLFVGAGVFTPLMAVREVQVVGAKSVDAAAVQAALNRFDGTPLALVDDAEVHRALEPFPLIQRYAVERVPPHTLVVKIEERVPVISVPGADGVSLYDAAGVLLGSVKDAPAGVPTGEGALTDLGSAAFRSASRALRDMPVDLRKQITTATATSAQDVTFTLDSGITVLWGEADDSRRKAVVLQSILTSLAGQPITRIDVSSTEAPVYE
ncbi:FtsQ-type POTRA domain-containing protein [Leucobacter sp. NPDC058333]|uniref:FtsQ-type POTRA domain-containing protein n=1 Tax=Leucobacter sp. NPDC058333 TaxID=3346450 RepID=UPI0036570009